MLAARGRFDLTVVDGRVYAVGGCDGNNELASVECYQPQLDRWSPRAALHMARSNQGGYGRSRAPAAAASAQPAMTLFQVRSVGRSGGVALGRSEAARRSTEAALVRRSVPSSALAHGKVQWRGSDGRGRRGGREGGVMRGMPSRCLSEQRAAVLGSARLARRDVTECPVVLLAPPAASLLRLTAVFRPLFQVWPPVLGHHRCGLPAEAAASLSCLIFTESRSAD